MLVENDKFIYVLNDFNLSDDILCIDVLTDTGPIVNGQAKMIYRVKTESNDYVVKLIRENRSPIELLERQSRFAEYLQLNGIHTPIRYKSNNNFFSNITIKNHNFCVTVEDYIGDEVKYVDNTMARSIGELHAKCHCTAMNYDNTIGSDGLFVFGGYNELSGINTFKRIMNNPQINLQLAREILAEYDKKIESVRTILSLCPKHAAQGDISINNLSYQNGDLWIFDYNNACDAYLITDFIIQGLFTAYSMDYLTELSLQEHEELFTSFMLGYTSVRTLEDLEKTVFQDISAVSRAFYSLRIEYDKTSLEETIKRGDYVNANKALENTLHLLRNQWSYI